MSMFQWFNPSVKFVEPEGVYSAPTSFFLASMEAGLRGRLQQREAANREAQLRQQAEQFERMMQERAADNERDWARIHQADRLAQEGREHAVDLKRAEWDRADTDRRREVGLRIRSALAAGNEGEARALAASHGLSVEDAMGAAPAPVTHNPLRPAQPMPPMAPAVEPPPLAFEQDDPDREHLTAASAPPPAEPAAPPAPVVPPPLPAAQQAAPATPTVPPGLFRIQAPGLSPFTVAPFEAANVKAAQDEKQKEINLARVKPAIEALAPRATSPHQKEAFRLAAAEAESVGLSPEKFVERYGELEKDLRSQAEAEKRSRIAAAGQRARLTTPTPAERGKAAKAERLLGVVDQIASTSPLSDEARKILLKDIAREEAFTKWPIAKVIATTTGLYRTLEQKLPADDRRLANLYKEVLTVLLRDETGAVINESEWPNIFERYLPQVGDNNEDVGRKTELLRGRLMELAEGAQRAMDERGKASGKPGAAPKGIPADRLDQFLKRAQAVKD